MKLRARPGGRRPAPAELERDHRPAAVARRLASGPSPSYLRDVVFGAIDGTVTTFAVVAGVVGADLAVTVVVVLGCANLLADGFSMAAGNFSSLRAEEQRRARIRSDERRHIRRVPEGEREEVRQLFAAKGFEGEDLERAVEILTADEERWIELMMREEHGFERAPRSPWRAGLATFGAFVVVGFVPLAAFVVDIVPGVSVANPFAWSVALTAVAFALVGVAKGAATGMRWTRSMIETLAVGGAAAGVAFAVGVLLRPVL